MPFAVTLPSFGAYPGDTGGEPHGPVNTQRSEKSQRHPAKAGIEAFATVSSPLAKDDPAQGMVLFVYYLGTIVWLVLENKDRLALAN
jgi:hypothetical protein